MANKDDSYKLLPELIAQMDAMKPFTRREIQSLFDDCMEGTNQQLVYYLLGVVRLLASQNEGIPDYIEDAIKEYISSGEIEKVLADVLAGYMLNVKNPPEGLTPAVGDGTANDTEAIQGCIDYAYNNGGMAVYFPSGAYLCSSLTLKDTTTLFGQDRYTTRIVLQGGATSPLLSGSASKLTISGIGLDGNGDVQVNNVNLVDVTVDNAIIINALLTDGFDLLKVVVNNDMQISGVMLDHAINNALVLSGNGIVNAENVVFGSLSTLVGEYYVDCGVSDSTFTGLSFVGQATKYINVIGNNNIFSGTCSHSPMPKPDDSGNNNSFDFWGSFVTEKYLGDGDYTYTGNYAKTVSGASTENIVGNSSFNSGNRTEIYNGTHKETSVGKTVTSSGDITETSVNRMETASGKYTQNSGSEEINVTGNSVENTGEKTVTVGGNKTETVNGDYSQDINGSVTIDVEENVTETATKRTENVTDFDMNTVNPMQYKNPAEVPDCEYFDYVPMKDRNGTEYRVLVENANTPQLEGVVADKYIIIGDSYAAGYTAGGNVTGFPIVMADMMGWTLNTDYWHNEVGGVGFAAIGSDPGKETNFRGLLEQVLESMTDVQKTSVKHVLFAGGWNDRSYSQAQITQAMEQCMDYVHENLPNATAYVAHIGWSRQQSVRKDIVNNSIPAYQQAGKYGAIYITNSEFSLHDYDWISTVDNQHPLQDGQNNIARCMLEGFRTGVCNNIYPLQFMEVSLASDMLNGNPGFGSVLVENGLTTWIPGRMSLGFVENKTIQGGDPITLATITGGTLMGWSEGTNSFYASASGYIQFNGSTFHQFIGGITVADGKIQLNIQKLVEGGGGFETFNNVSAIRIDCDTVACSSLLT